jgi:SAM-dependent methyltransferase
MFWFDPKNPSALFMDKRNESHVLCDGRTLEIKPDQVADFTAMPFPDCSFYLVVFDPPHMNSLGGNSWLAKKYGRLIGDWRDELREGFSECLRVLKPNGTLIFKWNTTDIPLAEVLALAPIPPLFGHTTGRQAKTVWCAFLKPNDQAERPALGVTVERNGRVRTSNQRGTDWRSAGSLQRLVRRSKRS